MRPDPNYSAALAIGARTYSTGKPCRRGHDADRYVNGRACVQCQIDKQQKWRCDNPEEMKRQNQAYVLSGKAKAACRKWSGKNRDTLRANSKKWRENNPERRRAHFNNRRARELDAPGSHTQGDIVDILRLQRGRCACCRVAVGSSYHVDHIIPISRGGHNSRSNLQILCGPCNQSKHARDPIEFMQSRGALL